MSHNEFDAQSATRARLEEIERELAELRSRRDEMRARWIREKELIDAVRGMTERIEQEKQRAAQWERDGEYAKVAEIRYGILPDLERRAALAAKDLSAVDGSGRLLKEDVDAEDIAEVVANWTGIPVTRLLESERAKLLTMEEHLHRRIVGQSEAVSAVCHAIRRARAGLQDRRRPIGSFIFLGTTGVGKTELARALAEFLFDDERAMVRLDMSEYTEKFSVSRLVGAPPGYVGYEEGGQLTEAVRRKPYSVILLDEIEKAHPDVFNILLQVLDDGRLTDSQGRTVDFTNTIVIMTSNIGSQTIQEALRTAKPEDVSRAVDDLRQSLFLLLRGAIRPEFLNRIDEVIFFRPLLPEDIRKIVDIQVGYLARRVHDESDIVFDVPAEVRDWLGQLGYDVSYGARPLKRVVQRYLTNPLAEKLLAGEVARGSTVLVSLGNRGALEWRIA
jgi:ATP-dependent Clp protease ATP-binding subunit ClpB